jgi:hypothetical protein
LPFEGAVPHEFVSQGEVAAVEILAADADRALAVGPLPDQLGGVKSSAVPLAQAVVASAGDCAGAVAFEGGAGLASSRGPSGRSGPLPPEGALMASLMLSGTGGGGNPADGGCAASVAATCGGGSWPISFASASP